MAIILDCANLEHSLHCRKCYWTVLAGIVIWMSHYNLISSGYLTVIVGYVPCWWGFSAESCLTLPTPWTVAHQAPLCVGFPRQEYWSHGHFLCQEIFQTQGSNPGLLHYRQILHRLSHQGSPYVPYFSLNQYLDLKMMTAGFFSIFNFSKKINKLS